jgi:hypothetical protein
MEKHSKGVLKAVLWYLAIQIVFCIVSNKPGTSIISKPFDAVLLCVLAGPFMWIPYLIYPILIIILIYILQKRIKIKITPSFIPSSIIFYGVTLALANYAFDFFETGTEPRKFMFIAGISCTIGYFYSIYKTPVHANSSDTKKRTPD